ncbi:2'-5' RNA ligase family protein [Rhizobium grahamii]|uniref:2',5' RNA ligase n=1 Tax=Rhizobium grahamii CCGE 502 TaxID=990285 RepID=S3I444_9HYPH|nr:2'-5' RNA ligase family protein [Rhizobium grahamii]EPE99931.1 2',5' RNA ligase [Rhizobium grahamii CCGE 502]
MHENLQASFDFASPKARQQLSRFARESLFFAILPDRQSLDECVAIQQWLQQDYLPLASLRPPSVVHVSLYCVGKSVLIPETMVAAARRAGAAIEACQFELAFNHVITFLLPQNNAIVLAGNGGRELLRQLHVQIAIEMQRLGEDANLNPNFQPHATLLYDKDVVPRIALQKPVVIAAREFVLLHNRRGQAGYEELGRWPLHARG